MDGQGYQKREDIFSKPVRAGKRTYFFDVKATRGNDYYLTITESKRRVDDNGKFIYDKHKLFLYKEDFEKFADGLSEVMEFIKREKGDDYGISQEYHKPKESTPAPDSEAAEAAPAEEAAEAAEAPETEETKSTDESYSSDISFDDLGDDDK